MNNPHYIDAAKNFFEQWKLHKDRIKIVKAHQDDSEAGRQAVNESEAALHRATQIWAEVPMSKGKLMCELHYIYGLTVPEVCEEMVISSMTYYKNVNSILTELGKIIENYRKK